MAELRTLLCRYLRQEQELGMPSLILTRALSLHLTRGESSPQSAACAVVQSESAEGMPRFQLPKAVLNSVAGNSAPKRMPIKGLAQMVEIDVPANELDFEGKRELLKELFYQVQGCKRCGLCAQRTKAVFGAGSVNAPLVVVGEAPDSDEDAQGLPLVGKAGKLLEDMLKAIKLDRKQHTFITNTLKCRLPENRAPHSSEVELCLPVLKRQIEIIRPKALLLLGQSAAQALLERTGSIEQLRNQVYSYGGISAVVTYHPAELLRSTEYKRPAWEDLQQLQRILEERGVYGLQ